MNPSDSTPKNLEAEAAMVAAMMADPRALEHASGLSALAFYSDRYRSIFLAAAKCYARRGAVDIVLVKDELQEAGQLDELGGVQELAKLTDPDVFTYGHSQHYVEILQRCQAQRAAVVAASDLVRIAAEADAPAILAAFRDRARKLEEHARRGESLRRIEMAEVAFGSVPAIPWIAEDWFGVGDSFVLGGEWGSGKSYLALDLAVSAASGLSWLGHIPIVTPVPVLYLDEENSEILARQRLGLVMNGRDLNAQEQARLPIRYLTLNRIKLNTPRGQDIVRREVEALGAKLVILDSMVRFARKLKSTDNDALADFHDEAITPLKAEMGVAVFGLDHMRKPGVGDEKSDPAHRIQGGQEKSSYGDGVATFSRNREDTTGELRASKVRWTGTLPPRVKTEYHESEDGRAIWIRGTDAAIDAELAVRDILVDVGAGIRATGLFKRAEARGVGYGTARRAVQRMVKRRSVIRTEVDGGVVYNLADGPML